MDGYIRLGGYERWAGGGVMPNASGGGVSLVIPELPDKATFWWEWGDDGDTPPLRVELMIPEAPKLPENIGYYCCRLYVHVLPSYQVKAEVSITYVEANADHVKISNEGPLSLVGYQETSIHPMDWK